MKILKFILLLFLIPWPPLGAQSILNHYEAGLKLLEGGSTAAAYQIFNQIITERPYYYDAYVGRARCHAMEGREKEAMDDFAKALEIKPGWYEALFYRGQQHEKTGRYRQALGDYEACLRARQGWVPAMRSRGSTLWKLGRKDEALKALDEAIARTEEQPVAGLFTDRARMRAGTSQPNGAVEDVGKALSLPGAHDSLYLFRAKLMLGLADTLAALKDIDRYLGRIPDDQPVRKQRALLHTSRREYALALKDLNHLIQELKITSDAVLYEARGICQLRLGQPAGAVSDFSRALAMDRENDEWYLLRAEAYAVQGKDEAALADYRRLIRFGSDDPRPWIGRAKYYIGRKKYDLALADLNEAIKAHPTAEGHYQRAICYYELRDDRKACEDLQVAATLGHAEAARRAKEFCR